LSDRALRIEINDGLNVIEQWNSANDFIFFAHRGEVSSNRREDPGGKHAQPPSAAELYELREHALVQKVLARPARDLHALTWMHVNPYGRFDLDMRTRTAVLA
jgi:hypothetical protein